MELASSGDMSCHPEILVTKLWSGNTLLRTPLFTCGRQAWSESKFKRSGNIWEGNLSIVPNQYATSCRVEKSTTLKTLHEKLSASTQSDGTVD